MNNNPPIQPNQQNNVPAKSGILAKIGVIIMFLPLIWAVLQIITGFHFSAIGFFVGIVIFAEVIAIFVGAILIAIDSALRKK